MTAPLIAVEAIDPNLRPFARALVAADGGFVDGRTLARAGRVPFEALSHWMKRLRAATPGALIEAERGRGYRLVTPAAPVPPARAAALAALHAKPINATRNAKDRLAEFAPGLVEAIAAGALDQGETLQIFTARLIAYGLEVYCDLVVSGERP